MFPLNYIFPVKRSKNVSRSDLITGASNLGTFVNYLSCSVIMLQTPPKGRAVIEERLYQSINVPANTLISIL
jgi:hypothetical protein